MAHMVTSGGKREDAGAREDGAQRPNAVKLEVVTATCDALGRGLSSRGDAGGRGEECGEAGSFRWAICCREKEG